MIHLYLHPIPRFWVASLAVIAVVAITGSFYFGGTAHKSDLQLILAAVAVTMAISAILAERGDGQFLKVLFWGTYISLLLLMKSSYWVWELGEAYPVKPVAAMIQRGTEANAHIYTSFAYHRPSLDFYSHRTVISVSSTQLQDYWQHDKQSYFLLDRSAIQNLQQKSMKLVDQVSGWTLVTNNAK